MDFKIVHLSGGEWAVVNRGGLVISLHPDNSSAWRALDRLEREPINRQEEVGDWISQKILKAWPGA